MKNVKTITVLTTIIASTLFNPLVFANKPLINRIFSAETGQKLCSLSIPMFISVALTGLSGLFGNTSTPIARTSKITPQLLLTATEYTQTMVRLLALGTSGTLASYLGICIFEKHIRKTLKAINR